jgi:hypothetical protein
MKRKLAIRLVLVATVFAGVFGLADSLTFTAGNLGATQTVVAACQATAFTATYTSTYSATAPVGYQVTTVTIAGTTAPCFSKSYRMTLTGAAGVALGAEATGTTSASAVPFNATFTGVSAAAVTGISLEISG